MKKILNFTGILVLIFLMLNIEATNAQKTKKNKAKKQEDAKLMKLLVKTGNWQSVKTYKNGGEFDFESIAGKVIMTFNTRIVKKIKQVEVNGKMKNKKVKETLNLFKMDIGGNDRIFDYVIKNDSVKFTNLNNYNDYRIVRADEKELVLEHDMGGDLFRWVMEPQPKQKKIKAVSRY